MRLTKNRMRRPIYLLGVIWGISAGLWSCSNLDQSSSSSSETGTLVFTANGEAFVREGLLSSDQWQVQFDHVYVTFDEIWAAQESLTYGEASGSATGKVINSVQWEGPKTVDLAVGDAPPTISQISAPVGQYRSLAWWMSPAEGGPAQGTSISIVGNAKKATQTLAFTLRLEPTLSFQCGAYVGDERKGIVQPEASAELEATFHFDHLFGDGTLPADDEINRDALGIAPLAALAPSGTLDADLNTLLAQLSPEDSNKLQQILLNLGHVGEGHCESKTEEQTEVKTNE